MPQRQTGIHINACACSVSGKTFLIERITCSTVSFHFTRREQPEANSKVPLDFQELELVTSWTNSAQNMKAATGVLITHLKARRPPMGELQL